MTCVCVVEWGTGIMGSSERTCLIEQEMRVMSDMCDVGVVVYVNVCGCVYVIVCGCVYAIGSMWLCVYAIVCMCVVVASVSQMCVNDMCVCVCVVEWGTGIMG